MASLHIGTSKVGFALLRGHGDYDKTAVAFWAGSARVEILRRSQRAKAIYRSVRALRTSPNLSAQVPRGYATIQRMPLILILIILLVIFGGGGYYMGPGLGYYGGGGISLILLIVILFLLFGRGRTRV